MREILQYRNRTRPRMTFNSFALISAHKGCFPDTRKRPQGHSVAIQSNMQNGERVLCEINGPSFL